MRQLGVIAVPSANPTLTSLCENYVGRVGPQSPTGRLLFSTPKGLLVAGCGLVARPTRQFSHRLVTAWGSCGHGNNPKLTSLCENSDADRSRWSRLQSNVDFTGQEIEPRLAGAVNVRVFTQTLTHGACAV